MHHQHRHFAFPIRNFFSLWIKLFLISQLRCKIQAPFFLLTNTEYSIPAEGEKENDQHDQSISSLCAKAKAKAKASLLSHTSWLSAWTQMEKEIISSGNFSVLLPSCLHTWHLCTALHPSSLSHSLKLLRASWGLQATQKTTVPSYQNQFEQKRDLCIRIKLFIWHTHIWPCRVKDTIPSEAWSQ